MKKTFTKQEIRDLLNQVIMDEVSFTRMVEIMNERVSERVSETNEPQYKDGDFVVNMRGRILIFKNKVRDNIYSHAYLADVLFPITSVPTQTPIERCATEAEKQELLNALAKVGKRWNAEKKCIEDIRVRKFKKGDKVMLKSGRKSIGGLLYLPVFDQYIGNPLTVSGYTESGNVFFDGFIYRLDEDWLEPYVEKPKKGDLAIFWDGSKEYATIKIYDQSNESEKPFRHKDNIGLNWKNAIKFESKEQYERLIKGEI